MSQPVATTPLEGRAHALAVHERDGCDEDDCGLLACEAGVGGMVLLLTAFNRDPHDAALTVPPGRWRLRLDSSGALAAGSITDAGRLDVPARSLLLLRSEPA